MCAKCHGMDGTEPDDMKKSLGKQMGNPWEVMHKILNNLVEQGVAVIIISSELPEVLGMSDRILVMAEGEIVSEFERGQGTKEEIMEYATGSARGSGAGG